MQQRDMAPMKHEGNMMHDKNSMKHTAKAKKAHVKHRAHKMKEDVKEGAHKMNVKAKNAMHGDDTMENNGSK
jgi:phosphosulfolactate synthase (CoM biosynthesis protein A)